MCIHELDFLEFDLMCDAGIIFQSIEGIDCS